MLPVASSTISWGARQGRGALYIPLAPGGVHHLAFDPAVAGHSEDFGGGPLALLFLPSLDLQMSAQLRRNDHEYGIRPMPRNG
jgi:hypothetical protein